MKYFKMEWNFQVTPPFPIGSNSVAAVKLASNEPQAKSLGTVSGYGLTSPVRSSNNNQPSSTHINFPVRRQRIEDVKINELESPKSSPVQVRSEHIPG